MKKTIIAALIASISTTASADTFGTEYQQPLDLSKFGYLIKGYKTRTLNFSEAGFSGVYGYRDDSATKPYRGFYVKIASSIDGKQRLYVHDTVEDCHENYKTERYTEAVLRVNGTNVRFAKMCSDEESGIGTNYTPETTKGADYVVGQFKRSNFVTINIFGDIAFDAHGFVKEWNSFGGDAL